MRGLGLLQQTTALGLLQQTTPVGLLQQTTGVGLGLQQTTAVGLLQQTLLHWSAGDDCQCSKLLQQIAPLFILGSKVKMKFWGSSHQKGRQL